MIEPEFVDSMSNTLFYMFIAALIIGCIYGYFTGYKPAYFSILDELKEGKINIGYVEESETPIVYQTVVVEEQKPKKPAHSKELIEECTSTLVGLGVRRSVAKKDVINFLNDNPEVKTVEGFVKGVFKK